MSTEEQKSKIERMYNSNYESAFDSNLDKDLQSFHLGKYLAVSEVMEILGYSLKRAYIIVPKEI